MTMYILLCKTIFFIFIFSRFLIDRDDKVNFIVLLMLVKGKTNKLVIIILHGHSVIINDFRIQMRTQLVRCKTFSQ